MRIVAVGLCAIFLLACEQKKIIECVDQQNNPVNCPGEVSGDGAAATGGEGEAAAGQGTGGDPGGDAAGDTGEAQGGDVGIDGDVNNVCEGAEEDYSCAKRCGQFCNTPPSPCQCDEFCFQNGDCCEDYYDVCADIVEPNDDGGDDDGGDAGSDPDYEFPSPFDVQKLSFKDCKGMATGNSSWCETYDCRGIVTDNYNLCSTKDCKGIASANKSFCGSYDCRGIADGKLCDQQFEECEDDAPDSDTRYQCKNTHEGCINDARSWCKSYDCRAIVTGDAGYCSSGGDNGNCKAVVKKNASFCWFGDNPSAKPGD